MQFSHDLDIQSLDKLSRIEWDLRDAGIELRLANVHHEVARMLHGDGFAAKIGEDRIHRTVDDAIRSF